MNIPSLNRYLLGPCVKSVVICQAIRKPCASVCNLWASIFMIQGHSAHRRPRLQNTETGSSKGDKQPYTATIIARPVIGHSNKRKRLDCTSSRDRHPQVASYHVVRLRRPRRQIAVATIQRLQGYTHRNPNTWKLTPFLHLDTYSRVAQDHLTFGHEDIRRMGEEVRFKLISRNQQYWKLNV